MEFKKYSSIENSYRDLYVDKIRTYFPGETFVVQEKVDGCLESRTKIAMADGSTKTITNIVNNKITDLVLGMDENGKIIETPILNHFNNGKTKDWLKIEFSKKGGSRGSPYGIVRCTPNHKFYVNGEYIPAENLRAGNFITHKRSELYLSFIQKEILKGKMLGDGSLVNSSVSFNQKKEHEQYIDYTLELLQNIAGNKQKEQISGYGTTMCRTRTISNIKIQELFSNWFTDKKVVPKITLSPISLAFWYMDDGSLSHHKDQNDRACFATNGFDEESVDNLLNSLSNLGLKGEKYQSKGWIIRLNCDSADKMFTLIAPYIPEVMQYKLPERYRLGSSIFRLEHKAEYKPNLEKQEILSIEKCSDFVSKNKYDIETGTHNFFANGVLVHNSNFAFYTDGKEVKPAKRTMFLEGDAVKQFFHADKIIERYHDKILGVFESILEHVNGAALEISIHGELCGGNYPHPDVEQISGVKGVNSKVYYSPDLEFTVFDIKVNGSYIGVQPMNTVCTLNGVPFCGVLFEGKLDECLAYNNKFPTTIPGMFDLPPIEGNNCEGVVIRTKKSLYCPNGERLLLKNKNEAFNEKNGVGKIKTKRESKPFPEHLVKYRDEIELFITENRLRNVISKTGVPEEKGKVFGVLIKEFNHDIIIDFLKENEDFKELGKSDQKLITNHSNKQACVLIRRNLDNIVDGRF